MIGSVAPGHYYRVCNRLLDVETNEHCEYDGEVPVDRDGAWHCPSCGTRRWVR